MGDLAVSGYWLDLISKVFSNLNDSMWSRAHGASAAEHPCATDGRSLEAPASWPGLLGKQSQEQEWWDLQPCPEQSYLRAKRLLHHSSGV